MKYLNFPEEERKQLYKPLEKMYKKMKVIMLALQGKRLSFVLNSFNSAQIVPVELMELVNTVLYLRATVGANEEDFTCEEIWIVHGEELLLKRDMQIHIPKHDTLEVNWDFKIGDEFDWTYSEGET